jgi:hypothetical protein
MKHCHLMCIEITMRTLQRTRNFSQQHYLLIMFFINGLIHIYRSYKSLKIILGMAIAKCLASSSNFSITNKHRMMGEHSR